MKPTIKLQSSVVNHNIVYESQNGDNSNGLGDQHFVGELINYVILQRPAINITTGANSLFTIQANFKGNGVFWANPTDAIANNLFKNNLQSKSPMPGYLAGKTVDPLASTQRAPVRSVWEGAKHIASKLWDNR